MISLYQDTLWCFISNLQCKLKCIQNQILLIMKKVLKSKRTGSILLLFAILFFQSVLNLQAKKPSWPREIKTKEATIVIYQPQIEKFSGDMLEARSAIAVTTKKGDGPVFGAAWYNSRVSTDIETREVLLEDLVVKSIKFPEASQEEVDMLVNLLENEVPKWEITLSLDRLLASINPDENASGGDALYNLPPEVIFSEEASMLISIDGDPIYREIEGLEKYKYILNTPFFIATDNEKEFFLYGDRIWYSSGDLYGDWKVTTRAPEELQQIMEESEKQKKKESGSSQVQGKSQSAKIYLRTHQAELLQSLGKPKYNPIEGTDLLYMSNTEDDIIMDINTQTYYILISGRWYSSSSMTNNDWTYMDSRELPEDFGLIPSSSDVGSVRASVAGTEEAMDATLENTIPQTAQVNRNDAKVEVEYDGEASFEAIKGTDISYAVNTDKSVLMIDNRYYCCDDAVWFIAYGPDGPWSVCVDVPVEFQDIPAEYPVYNVKYVHVYHYTPTIVYMGYTPGYIGSYAYHGVVVYGTGYYYQPWYRTYYYPRHTTYGYGVHYSPYSGWGFSYGISYGWFHVSYRVGPGYYHGYWGPAGYHAGYRYGYGRSYHYGYNRGYTAGARAGYYYGTKSSSSSYDRSTHRSTNVYRNRETGVSRTGINTVTSRNNNTTTVTSNNRVRRSGSEVSRTNNVYTDNNGNVHKRTNNGWERRENGEWTNTGEGTNRASTNSSGRASTTNRSSDPNKDRGNSSNSNRNNKDKVNSGNRSSNTGNFNRSGSSPNKTTGGSTTTGSSSGKQKYNNLNKTYQSRSTGTQKTNQYKQTTSKKKTSTKAPPMKTSSTSRRKR